MTGIKITGNATAVTGDNWKALYDLYKNDSGWTNLSSLDLSGMTELTTIGDISSYNTNVPKLVEVKLPDSLTTIGEGAFNRCTGIRLTALPDGVESIGQYAFGFCTKLALTKLPDKVTSIGIAAFRDCTGIKLSALPDGVESIGQYAFYGCTGIRLTALPDGVESIGDGAFYGCTGIKLSALPDGVESIGSSAFSGCIGITLSALPDGVESIGDSAFAGCTGIKLTALPDGVESIGDNAFAGCTGIKLTALPDGVESIGKFAFYGCTDITEMTFPEKLTSIGEGAFSGCTSLAKLTFQSATASTIEGIAFNGVATTGTIYYPAGASGYTDDWKNGITGLMGWSHASLITLEVTYNDGATMADAIQGALLAAGVGKEQVTGIKITGNATAVTGDNWKALYDLYKNDSGWTNLSALHLSGMTALTTIGDMPSYSPGIPKLKQVKLPDSLTTIGDDAFARGTNLALTALPDGVESIGDSAFFGCTGIRLTALPDGVESIGQYAFFGCTGIRLTALPDGVESIGQYVFHGCTGIRLTALPDDVESIGDGAFYGCTGITEMTFPEKLTSIGLAAFYGCTSLDKLTFQSATAPTIGTSIFGGVATTGTIYYRAGYAPNWLDGSLLPGGWTHVLIYRLTVENGTDTTKASFYPEGGQAVIEADAAPGGKAFDRWETLGGGRFLNAASASTTFTMPAADTTVRATYRTTTPAPGPANAGINPNKATFDRYPSGKNHRDIPVTLSPGSHTLSGIRCGNVTLQAGRDYTVSGSRYTFTRTYLATLGKGTHAFIFDMSGGADPTFTLTVEDTRPGGG
ncbi:putative cell surface protein, partial [Dorea sp. D27]